MSHPQDVQPTKIHGDVERLVQANRRGFSAVLWNETSKLLDLRDAAALSVDADGTASGAVGGPTTQSVQEGRLPGARGSHDRCDPLGAKFTTDAFQDGPSRGFELHAQVVKADANPGHLQVHALEAVVWYFDIGKQAVGDFY